MISPQPKPEPRTLAKARHQRHACTVTKSVRSRCVERDGYCLYAKYEDSTLDCQGPSQWCHSDALKRFRTRGLPPEVRHTTRDSFIACQRHHDMYDGRINGIRLIITPLSVLGMDGPVRCWVRKD
jgi:hypothetical protein